MSLVKRGGTLICLLAIILAFIPISASAKDRVAVAPALKTLQATAAALKNGQKTTAEHSFSSFKVWWQRHKAQIANASPDASIDLSQSVGSASIALLNDRQSDALKHIEAIRQTLQDYQSGLYGGTAKSRHHSLTAYITELDNTRTAMQSGDWATAATQVKQLQQDWLSVEGDVVSQSQAIYTESEKELVMMDAYLGNPATREKALPMIKKMIANLEPLATANYGVWDAALIPIREGMEALLVIGALLTFAKKADSRQAKRWIWSGTALAVLVCTAVGAAVTLFLTVTAFGNNNSLINGWSGVIASLMLLYVGWWLHRNADIKRWNAFLRSKTQQALTRRRMFSFALLAFIAVLREGMETVIFLIGMAGRMPTGQLILGIAAGFGALVVIGFLMLKIGVLLPLRPFFLVSSLIVFYLCFKFMGSGIHSLQMAGVLPSTVSDALPSVNSLSIFPSWYSTIPQALFLIIMLVILLKEQLPAIFKHQSSAKGAQESK